MQIAWYQSLFWRMAALFLLLILLIGGTYVVLTVYYARTYVEEMQQQLHTDLAQHLIDEKFQDQEPFMEDGSINKPLFGDIMHDMMAVNRSIEVYLLAPDGQVRYSVVLDEQRMAEGDFFVDLGPIREFLSSDDPAYILGQDPLNPKAKRIFSVSEFESQGQSGYIYIILAGQEWQNLAQQLLESYTLRGGVTALALALMFALLLGLLLLGLLAKRLRKLIHTMQQFEDGDMASRVPIAGNGEIAQLGRHFNKMADAILRNFESVKSTERLRQDLIANVSHDLRTPLAAIHGYAETLQLKGENLSTEDRERYVKVILRNATKLKKLVSELFELSKLEAKQVKPRPEVFHVEHLLADLREQYQMQAQNQGVRLAIDVQDVQQDQVWADLALIERVCQNLLDNAMKFTPQGGEVRLALRQSDKPDWVTVEVQDTGMGIAAEDLPHIFDRYATKSRQDQAQSGTGLGLAIARKIMELHESTLRVRSKLKEGSSFTFELPLYQMG